MKLIVFCGIILLALLSSLILGWNDLENNKKPIQAISKSILCNIIILGIGTIWWFLSESDGISQGIGCMIYLGAIVGISIIDALVIYVLKKSEKNLVK